MRYGIRREQVKFMLLGKNFLNAMKPLLVQFHHIRYSSWYKKNEGRFRRRLEKLVVHPYTFFMLEIWVGTEHGDPDRSMRALSDMWLEYAEKYESDTKRKLPVVGLRITMDVYNRFDGLPLVHGVLSSMQSTLHFVSFIGNIPGMTGLTFPKVNEVLLHCIPGEADLSRHGIAALMFGLVPPAPQADTVNHRILLDNLHSAFPNIEHLGLDHVLPYALDRWVSLQSVALHTDNSGCVNILLVEMSPRLRAADRVLRLVLFAGMESEIGIAVPVDIRRIVLDPEPYFVSERAIQPQAIELTEGGCFEITLYNHLNHYFRSGWNTSNFGVHVDRANAYMQSLFKHRSLKDQCVFSDAEEGETCDLNFCWKCCQESDHSGESDESSDSQD